MKKILFGSMIAVGLLTGCSSVYRSGQTPDDLYYSPGKEVAEYVNAGNADSREYQEYVSTSDDRYLRMKVANRDQWSSIDHFSYWNDMRYNFPAYAYNYSFYNPYTVYSPWGLGYSNPWALGLGFSSWNSWGYGNYYGGGLGWSHPLYTVIGYANPKALTPTYTSGSNLSAYRNKSYNNYNYGNNKNGQWGTPGVAGAGSNSFGNLVRRVFSSPSTTGGSNSSYDRPGRTFSTPAASSSAGMSSSAGGSSGGFKSSGSSAGSGRGGRN
ncbi:MAG: hypothetical protein I8H66_08725 [Sphingobacteriia bacterium]|nr:hypothetical protein [Sphingobacteriia bacterium]